MTNHGGRADEPTSYGLQPPSAPAAFGAPANPYSGQFAAPNGANGTYQPTAHHTPPPQPAAAHGTAEPGSGRRIGGRYRLVSRLGHGGMGTVWKARDEVVDRDVAVKEPRVPDHLPESMRQTVYQRMQREARAAARIDHPSVVTVHDVVIEDGRPWIVMELVRGRSLADRLTEGTLDPRETARIGLSVLGALSAAHAAGVLHRDVKPDNVLLGPDERVVLTDFGIAQIEGEQGLTETGAFVGSPEFVAPERVLGQVPGPESDLWSLGVVLYAAVEGVSPFRRTNTPATLQSILSAEPQTPSRGSGALGTLVMQLLRKDPAARPTSAEARQTLESVARPTAPQPTAFAPSATSGTGSRWVPPVLQGNRKAQWGLGGGVLALGVAAALLIVNPFAVGPAIPLHWKVREEPEIVRASLAVPEDYIKTTDADKGWVGFSDPSGVFVIYLTRATEEPKPGSSQAKPDIGSADAEADKLKAYYQGGTAPGLNDPVAKKSEAAYQGMDSAEVQTVYRKSGSDAADPKRLIRTQIIVNKAKNVSWQLEVRMPEKGESRKDGDKLFENVRQYLKLQEK
ncbi:serine/threonine-protein kinase [Streptomyces sp. QH1-20]|uniref:serine/threonine-protein kinase n=1 Tax=Streptomyces sp. QH1-20 TaxID=3240934 RepID=UPI0035148351